MKDTAIYYLKPEHLSESHKQHISQGMRRMYAKKNNRRSDIERKHISDGMKRCWIEWKKGWGEEGEA